MPSVNTSKSNVFSPEFLHGFTVEVFKCFQIPEEAAKKAADVLAYSDIRGIDSHGIARLKTYYDLLKIGRINPHPDIRVIREKGSIATVDGDNGLGLVVGPKAMDIAMKKAKEHGSGWVSVCNTNHYGAAGYYPVMALEEDLIGMAMTNTTKGVAPFRGAEKMLGTNPVAMAFPAFKESPVVADFSTSTVSYGKVEIANRKGISIPEGWCIDKNGNPTQKPAEMLNGGALLPLGSDEEGSGHKGYCMASIVDILSGVLGGANWGPFTVPFAIHSQEPERSVGKGIGHFFGAMDIEGFRDKKEFKQSMDDWIQTMRKTKPLRENKPVLVPGDPEREMYRERSREGIPLLEPVIRDLKEIADELKITFKEN